MIITLLMDNPKSWFYPFAENLKEKLSGLGHEAELAHITDDIKDGELAFFLSCEKIIKQPIRDKNKHNLVVHSSPLPAGKGWSPMTWTILAGENVITNTLFEAVDAVDAGVIYIQNSITFEGGELLPELQAAQGQAIVDIIIEFVSAYPEVIERGEEQVGEESFYERRRPEDSKLDPNKTIADQFNLLRVVDNEKYPAFFNYKGSKYILKIYKDNN